MVCGADVIKFHRGLFNDEVDCFFQKYNMLQREMLNFALL